MSGVWACASCGPASNRRLTLPFQTCPAADDQPYIDPSTTDAFSICAAPLYRHPSQHFPSDLTLDYPFTLENLSP